MHSALLVGLLRAKMIGRSWKEAMSLRICSVKAPAMAATPTGKRWVVGMPTPYKQPISLLVAMLGELGATWKTWVSAAGTEGAEGKRVFLLELVETSC